MYFKKLELFGFKSFAEKTVLNFEPGVTAIVGPNGCGKSNISDAIKWVLGEQAPKSLRGSSMEDVIFNGTDKRQAVNFAEVNLVLDNSKRSLNIDFDEVNITRRLYRSGESEYLLNKTIVRLKDVTELLMGTGIGTDSYSLIEQGKIDMVLSSKPEDRRAIFEEASGITKFKSKKREALRKLEATETNLLRVNDIIVEVKRQINSIERQANKAARYKEQFETLKGMDLKLAYIDFQDLRKDQNDVALKAQELSEKESGVRLDYDNFNLKLGQLKSQLDKIEAEVAQLNEQEVTVLNSLNAHNNKINLNEERIQELGQRQDSLAQEKIALEGQIASLAKQVDQMTREVNGIESEKSSKVEAIKIMELDEANSEAAIKQAQEAILDSKARLMEIASLESRLKNDIVKTNTNFQTKVARQRRLQVEAQKINEELAAIEIVLAGIVDEVARITQSLDGISRNKQDLSAGIQAKSADLIRVEEKYDQFNQEYNKLNSKIEFLEDIKIRHEGYSNSVKTVLEHIESSQFNLTGVHGTVASLIDVDDRYLVAIEKALNGAIEAIIVDNFEVAKSAIRYLRENTIGRVTFVPINNSLIAGNQEIDRNDNIEGALGRATDFINTKDRFKSTFNSILKDIYLAEDFDKAVEIAVRNPAIKVVTLDGQFVSSTCISGGCLTFDKDTSLIGREARLINLKDESEKLKAELESLSAVKLNTKAELEQMEAQLEKLTQEIQDVSIAFNDKNNQRLNTESNTKRIKEELEVVNLELSEVDEEIDALKLHEERLGLEIESAQKQEAEVEQVMQQSQAVIDSQEARHSQIIVKLTQVRTELELIIKTADSKRNALNSMADSLNSQRLAFDTRDKEIIECKSKAEELGLENESLAKETGELQLQKQALAGQLSAAKLNRQDFINNINQIQAQLAAIQKQVDEIRDGLHQIEMKSQDIIFKTTNLKDRISQSYKVNIDELTLAEEELANLDIQGMSAEVTRLREKLESMGPVNLVAIEEHQSLSERFTFLTQQKDDLAKAKDDLMKAISELNKTTKDMFIDTFNKIHVEFKNYFRLLFGGGDAQLLLLDENDVLECGIEIVSRPPGKKLQNISLLSGGEKALTAMALLFSIFKVKPSPFCVLDEIDAPLDESNVDRFGRLLNEFLQTSQFIIITHNKKTINTSDIMYGITMEESGVSKVVSVKFAKNNAKQEPATITSG